MSAQLEAIFTEFFKKHPELEDNKDNRRELMTGLHELHKSVINTANLENVLKQHKDVFMFRKQLLPIYWPAYQQQSLMDAVSKRLGWTPLITNENVHAILSLLQRAGTSLVDEDNVYTACVSLGKSALEHNSPAPSPVPAALVPPAVFDWTSTATQKDIPLTDPDGNPPPNWFVQSLNREQTRSYVKRLTESNRPAISTELREGQLPLDADEKTMRAASSKQLANLIQRQRAAKYQR